MAQPQRRGIFGRRFQRRVHQLAQNRRIVPGMQHKSLSHHGGNDFRIDRRRANRILKRADEHRFVNEFILRAPQLVHFRA